jgi:signal peptidase II
MRPVYRPEAGRVRIDVVSLMQGRAFKLTVLAVVLATIGCDRATKRLALEHLADHPGHRFLADTVRLQFIENRGGFLGLGSNLPERTRTGLFVLGTGLLLVGVLVWGIRSHARGPAFAGLALLWAGGVSNLFDRVARGSVVDFLNVGIGPLRTGIFNVADMAIMAGCALLLVRSGTRPTPPDARPDVSDTPSAERPPSS